EQEIARLYGAAAFHRHVRNPSGLRRCDEDIVAFGIAKPSVVLALPAGRKAEKQQKAEPFHCGTPASADRPLSSTSICVSIRPSMSYGTRSNFEKVVRQSAASRIGPTQSRAACSGA